MPKFFEQGGGKVFVSITNATTREVHSYTHNTCVLVADWPEAIKKAGELVQEKQSRSYIESIEMFTTPRLCRKCLEHASQPLVLENAKHVGECLCRIENTPCGVHKYSGG
ncbi:MAG: hypothetical protein V1756_01210 [Patescibacteria group bacterium]